MPFAEDLSVFVDVAEFATAATLQGGTTVNVNFGSDYIENFGIAGTNPTAEAIATQIAVSDIGKTLTINSVVYTIMNRKSIPPDGAFVLLELQAP